MNPKLINPCDDCLVQACCYVRKNYKILYRQNITSADIPVAGCYEFSVYQVALWQNKEAIFRLQNLSNKYKDRKDSIMKKIRSFTLSNNRERTKEYNPKLKNKRKQL